MEKFSKIFHIASSNLRSARDSGAQLSREEFTTAPFKIYPRLPRLTLDGRIRQIKVELGAALENRRSARDFSDIGLSLEELGSLLFWSGNRKFYPSGGARYPLEIYPLVFKGGGELRRGLYHYNLKDNCLEIIDAEEPKENTLQKCFIMGSAKEPAVALIITAVFARTQMKYGERGYRFALIEAGHLGQNIYLVSGALGLKCCGWG
jgi:SagB-type dehydrogenase family enzyme